MIWTIAKKDFLLNLISARFVIGFMLCLVVIPFTLVVSVDHYRNRVQVHQVYEKEAADAQKDIRVYSYVRPEIVIPPQPLGIFSSGIGNNTGNRVKIQLGEYPLFPEGHVATRDNPLLNAFFSIDFATVIAILMSLLALVFSYDVFTREREDGTLRAALANDISRTAFLAGKMLGIAVTLLPVLLFCFLLGVLVVALSPAVHFGAAEWGGVALLFISALIYMAVFILLGMFISTRAQRSSTSIVVSLLCWIWFLFLMPNIASYLSQSFVKTEMYDNVQFALKDLDKEFWKDNREKSEDIKKELGVYDMSYWNQSSGDDGELIITGVERALMEYHRRLNEWGEPARIDYADKKWAVQRHYLDELIRQQQWQQWIACLSPSEIFRQATDGLCRTDMHSFLKYMESVRDFRETFIRYYTDKKRFESIAYFTAEPLENMMTEAEMENMGWEKCYEMMQKKGIFNENFPFLNTDDVPRYLSQPATTAAMLNEAASRLTALLGLAVMLLLASIAAFMKYNIR